MENQNQEEKKYDITKSNFFANINTVDKIDEKEQENPQYNNNINGPYSYINTQNNINQNINNFENQMNLSQNSNFYPQNNISTANSNFYTPHYQVSNPYENQLYNQGYYLQQQDQLQSKEQSQSFIQKVGESAMNLIKKEDPMNLINDISPNEFEANLKETIKERQCQILEKSKINSTEIKAIISNPRKINDSYIKSSYLLYDISTPKLNWLVNRRYSDFIWLREALCSLFPSTFIPQLPSKKIGNRRFEEDFIEKRINGLQFFLDEILKNEDLKASEPIISFLPFDRGFFEQQMKIIVPKTMNVDSILGIKTFSGKIVVADLDNEYIYNNNYYNDVATFFGIQNDLIKNIKSSLENYNIHMVEACKNLEQIENGFLLLSKYNSKANLAKDISNTFEQYQIFCKNWKRIHINQTSIIGSNLTKYFKRLKNYGLSLIELIERQNIVKKDYQKIRDELMNKKEGYWKKMDITKWEMNPMDRIDSALLFRDKSYAFSKMCFQETVNLTNKGDLLGYFYIQNINNIKTALDNLKNFGVSNLVDFSKEIEPTVTDSINVWSNLASNL